MRKKRWKRRLACLFVLGLLAGVFYGQKERVFAGQEENDLYALEFTTGSKGIEMKEIQAIVVNYTDTDKKERSYAISPEEALDNGFTKNYESTSANNFVYKEKEDIEEARRICGNEEAIDLSCQKTMFYPYQTQALLFRPFYNISKLNAIKIITGKKASWEIQGIRLIQVNEESMGMVGNATVYSFLQPNYEGTLLAEMSYELSMTWTTDAVYDLCSEDLGSKGKETNYRTFRFKDSQHQQYKVYDGNRDDFVLMLDIADEFVREKYQTGLETLATAVNRKQTITDGLDTPDILYITIWYEDIYGDKRCAKFPFFSNLLVSLQGKKDKLIGVAQSGETMAVTCRLPGFQRLITDEEKIDSGISLLLSNEKLDTDYGGLHQNAGNTKFSGMKEALKDDTLYLTGICLYKKSTVELTPDIKDGEIICTLTSTDQKNEELVPDYYFVSEKASGSPVSYGEKQKFTMKSKEASKEKPSLPKQEMSNLYLVELTTDKMDEAETVNDLKIKLNYTVLSDNSTTGVRKGTSTTLVKPSNEYSVPEMVRRLYGTWPATGNQKENLAYHQGMKKGSTVRFLVSLSNVDTFISAKISFDQSKRSWNPKDSWQMASISISKVNSVGKRKAEFQNIKVEWGSYETASDRIFTREIKTQMLAKKEEQILLRKDESKTISFSDTKSVTEVQEEENIWDPEASKLSYDQVCTNMGFGKGRFSYIVDVKVAKAAEGDSENGDSGSKNYFFFRLNFEKGSSAFVLANQQLTADGFRAGQTEQFSISINQNMGELVSVDIIPDDTAEKSDVFDKLNIESIRVMSSSDITDNRCWEISNPGWVGIDYRDDDKRESDTNETSGRYEGELTNTFEVSKIVYYTKLLFTISTDTYDAGTTTYKGSVMASLHYTDRANEQQTANFDLVKQIYMFNQDERVKSITSDSAVSDPQVMFRENTTDRFFLNIENLKSVDNIELEVTNANKTTWNIKGIGVSTVSDVGELYYNDENQYEYTGKTVELAKQESKLSPICKLDASSEDNNSKSIEFEKNDLTAKGDSESSSTLENSNDSVNIFMFPKENSNLLTNTYNMSVKYEYINSFGKQFENGVNQMNKAPDCFYKLGITSRNFVYMQKIGFQVTGATDVQSASLSEGDHAIIQHIQGDTLLDTYYANLASLNLSKDQVIQVKGTYKSTETQKVALFFGEGTAASALDENKNIAVSIGFISSLGLGDKTYHTQYVYLTEQDYTKIQKGMIAEIEYQIPFAKEITDIRIFQKGKLDVVINGAIVSTYEKQAGANTTEAESENANTICTRWYTLNLNEKLNEGTTTYSNFIKDEGTKVPVTVTLPMEENKELPSNIDLEVKLNYRDNKDLEQEYTISSVREWMTPKSSTKEGKKIQLQFMLEDLKLIKSVSLRAIETNGTEDDGSSCSISNVTVEYQTIEGENKLEHAVDQKVTVRGVELKLVPADLYARAVVVNSDGSNGISMNSDENEDMKFLLTQGEKLKIDLSYASKSKTDGYSYRLYQSSEYGEKGGVQNEAEVFTVMPNLVQQATADQRGGVYDEVTIDTSKLKAGNYIFEVEGVESDQKISITFKVEEKTNGSGNLSESTGSNPPVTENIPSNEESTGSIPVDDQTSVGE